MSSLSHGEEDTIFKHAVIESILQTHTEHDAVKYITQHCTNNQPFSNIVSSSPISFVTLT